MKDVHKIEESNSSLLKKLFKSISISLLLIPIFLSGQNLIPNPGFEELFIPDEFQWVQPIGQYYHWESNDSHAGRSHSGEFFNGICMYNWHPCEYMHIKLSDTLEAGSTYHIGAWYRIASFKAKGNRYLYKLGAQFTDHAVDATRRFVINELPEVQLLLPDSAEKTEWNYTETIYTAKGNEEFITLGYFPALYFTLDEMKDYVAPTDSSLIELAEKSIGKKKKTKKYKEKDLAEFRKMINQKTRSERVSPRPKHDHGKFTLRYYFDDICIAKIDSVGTFNCEPNADNTLDTSLKDQVFRLNRIYFGSGGSTLLDSSFYELDRLSFFLNFKPNVKIKIIGHTDNIGKDKENMKLSLKRAEAVRNYLIGKGLKEERISFEGKGETEPITDNDTPQGRQINRRVEFRIIEEQ